MAWILKTEIRLEFSDIFREHGGDCGGFWLTEVDLMAGALLIIVIVWNCYHPTLSSAYTT
jgi:hypothetical protein